MPHRPLALLALFLPLLLAACASTTVKKDPGQHDRGIRYYRPKPHLLIQSTLDKPGETVAVSLEYLPAFAEEYSIHIRTGIGTNKSPGRWPAWKATR